MAALTLCVRTRIYRDGLAAALRALPEVGELDVYDSYDELQLRPLAEPTGVLIVDPRPHGQAPVSAADVRAIAQRFQEASLIVVGCDCREDEIVGILEAGAAAYITTEDSIEQFVATVRAAMKGELCCTPSIARRLQARLAAVSPMRSPQLDERRLSRREAQVIHLVQQGLSNKEIARYLSLELATVKNHVHNILAKFRVGSRHEAANAAGSR